MLTVQEINEISGKVSSANKVDIRYLLISLNDMGMFDKKREVHKQTPAKQAEHVASLRVKIEDPDADAIKNRLNELINALTDAEIIK